MKKSIEFVIYLAGVIFLSWNYYKLQNALGALSFIALVVFYLFGVSKFATWVSDFIPQKRLVVTDGQSSKKKAKKEPE